MTEKAALNTRIGILKIRIGPPTIVRMTEQEAIDYILNALSGGPSDDLRKAFETVSSVKSYRRMVRRAAKAITVPQSFRDYFHTAWTVEGFRWREAINDDALLLRALRAVLPPYTGQGLTMFRGEQGSRYDGGRLGFNWTPKRQIAEMFASGLCTLYEGGGILLTATVPATAVISGPNDHSRYLGEDEFVVDPALISDVTELARHL